MKLSEAIEFLKKGLVIYRPSGVMFTEDDKNIRISFADALADDWEIAQDFKKLCNIKCVRDNSMEVYYYKCDLLKNKRIVFDKYYRACSIISYDKFTERLLSNHCCAANWLDIKTLRECEEILVDIAKQLEKE